MAVPDTNTFSLNDVRVELSLPSTASLQDCIANADSAGYDPAYYSAPATSLLEFRNYEEPVAAGNTLRVTPSSIDTNASSSNTIISVESNTTWNVSESLTWVTTSVSSGSGNQTFTVSLAVNNTGSPRSGSVTVTTSSGSPSISRIITINQGSGFE